MKQLRKRLIDWMLLAAYRCRLKATEIDLNSDIKVLNIDLKAAKTLLGLPIRGVKRDHLLLNFSSMESRKYKVSELLGALQTLQQQAKGGAIADDVLAKIRSVRKLIQSDVC